MYVKLSQNAFPMHTQSKLKAALNYLEFRYDFGLFWRISFYLKCHNSLSAAGIEL